MSLTYACSSPITPIFKASLTHTCSSPGNARTGVSRDFSNQSTSSFLNRHTHLFPQAKNDILGAPITEEEFKASLALEITEPDEDPIAKSGYFQGDIMLESKDHLMQILEVNE